MDWNAYAKCIEFKLPAVAATQTPYVYAITIQGYNEATYDHKVGSTRGLGLYVSASELWLSSNEGAKASYAANDTLLITCDKYAAYVFLNGSLKHQFTFPIPLNDSRLVTSTAIGAQALRFAINVAPREPLYSAGEVTYQLKNLKAWFPAAPSAAGIAPDPTTGSTTTTTQGETTTSAAPTYAITPIGDPQITVTPKRGTTALPAINIWREGSLTIDYSVTTYEIIGIKQTDTEKMDCNTYAKLMEFTLPEIQPIYHPGSGELQPVNYVILLGWYNGWNPIRLYVTPTEMWLPPSHLSNRRQVDEMARGEGITKQTYSPNDKLQLTVDKFGAYVFINGTRVLQLVFPTPSTDQVWFFGIAPRQRIPVMNYQEGELTYTLNNLRMYYFAAPTQQGAIPDISTAVQSTTTVDANTIEFSISRPAQDWLIRRESTGPVFVEDYVVGTLTVNQAWLDANFGNAIVLFRAGRPLTAAERGRPGMVEPDEEQGPFGISSPVPVTGLTTEIKLSDLGPDFATNLANTLTNSYLDPSYDWSTIAVDMSDPYRSFFIEVSPENTSLGRTARTTPKYFKISIEGQEYSTTTADTTTLAPEESTTSLEESGTGVNGTGANGKGANSGDTTTTGELDLTGVTLELEKPAGDWVVTRPVEDEGANFRFAEDYDIGTLTISQEYLDKNVGPITIMIGLGRPDAMMPIYGLQLKEQLSTTTRSLKLSDCEDESVSAAATTLGRKILPAYPLADSAPDAANPNQQFFLEAQAQNAPSLKSRSPAEGTYFSITLDAALTTTTAAAAEETTTTAEDTTTLDGLAEQLPSEPIAVGGRRRAHRVSRRRRVAGRRQSKRAAKGHAKSRRGKKAARKTTRKH